MRRAGSNCPLDRVCRQSPWNVSSTDYRQRDQQLPSVATIGLERSDMGTKAHFVRYGTKSGRN